MSAPEVAAAATSTESTPVTASVPASSSSASSSPPTPAPVPSVSPNGRFLYFGYGSNLLPSILALKQVHVHSARPGFLQDVQLLFDLKVDSLVEPSYANLQRKVGSRVHGVVYELDPEDMLVMDRLEGNGRSYVREEFECCLYKDGEAVPCCDPTDSAQHSKVTVSAYICHSNNLAQLKLINHPPSFRYLEVLIQGAKHHKLDAEYVAWLEAHPFTPLPELQFTEEQTAAIQKKLITKEELEAHSWKPYMEDQADPAQWNDQLYVSLKGVVFDATHSKWSSGWKKVNAGRDMTVFTAGRVAMGGEAVPTRMEEFKEVHQKYINATLCDFATVFPIIGHTEEFSKFNF